MFMAMVILSALVERLSVSLYAGYFITFPFCKSYLSSNDRDNMNLCPTLEENLISSSDREMVLQDKPAEKKRKKKHECYSHFVYNWQR